ncbi:MAG: hypothetical protein KAS93_02115 [Gammaproteobacteria bacterium]|nr:hypothetical protein [Gammaproteobacteria bacterium]
MATNFISRFLRAYKDETIKSKRELLGVTAILFLVNTIFDLTQNRGDKAQTNNGTLLSIINWLCLLALIKLEANTVGRAIGRTAAEMQYPEIADEIWREETKAARAHTDETPSDLAPLPPHNM